MLEMRLVNRVVFRVIEVDVYLVAGRCARLEAARLHVDARIEENVLAVGRGEAVDFVGRVVRVGQDVRVLVGVGREVELRRLVALGRVCQERAAACLTVDRKGDRRHHERRDPPPLKVSSGWQVDQQVVDAEVFRCAHLDDRCDERAIEGARGDDVPRRVAQPRPPAARGCKCSLRRESERCPRGPPR